MELALLWHRAAGAGSSASIAITKYVKVAFFNGTSLRPLPPVASKNEGTRYFHIHEHDQLDENLVASWILA